jgi:hypothetical protein
MKKAKKKIYILLTRLPDVGSNFISFFTRFFYTHASIGLEEDKDTFYSFTMKGFRVEKITRYVKPGENSFLCKLYEMQVSEKTYEEIKKMINGFVSAKGLYHYAKIGVVFGIFQIPFFQKNHYFCSQFVAEVLEKTDAVRLKKKSCLYLPRDIEKLPNKKEVFKGDMRSLLDKFVLQPSLA